jgi:uncharacterized protein YwgA
MKPSQRRLVSFGFRLHTFAMSKIKSSKDIIMLLLYTPGRTGKVCESIEGQTRLMKMVFLFKKELAGKLDKIIDVSALPSFEAYDFGPFSAEVYNDLEFLVNNDFVTVKRTSGEKLSEEERKELEYWHATQSSSDEEPSEYVGRKFALTELGKSFVEEELIHDAGIVPSQLSILTEFKKRCVEASLRSLLRYVYTRYENMTTKSKIKEAVLQ